MLQASGEDALSKRPLLPGLYVTASPIGNLGDISLRALATLSQADAVVCEDTRVTGTLLHRYGIKKPLLSYHDHNADERLPEIMARLRAGESVALVSDAGTPLLSDPGFRLVQTCRAEGICVTAVPGASALLTALVSAGLPTDKFLFAGFLPPKSAARQKALAELRSVPATLVFYEAPSRLAAVLDDMENVLGSARMATAVVARELTKLFEDVLPVSSYRGRPAPKGELVILVGPPVEETTSTTDIDALLRDALRTMSLRDAVLAVTEATGTKKSDVYQRALGLKKR